MPSSVTVSTVPSPSAARVKVTSIELVASGWTPLGIDPPERETLTGHGLDDGQLDDVVHVAPSGSAGPPDQGLRPVQDSA